MKRLFGYLLVTVLALSVPEYSSDVGKLIPVETVLLRLEGNTVVLETDTGHYGIGTGVREAIVDMKETAEGVLFLDTADYLLLGKESGPWVGELKPYLKGKVLACAMEEKADLKMVTAYLAAHKPEYTIEEAYEGKPVERLSVAGGRYRLEKPEKSKNSA